MTTKAHRLEIANRRRGGWWRHLLRLGAAGLGAGLTAAAMAAVLVYTALAHDLPRLDRFEKMAAVGVTRFEAADGSLVGERYTERRLALDWKDLPRPMILAFLAAEDARFFEHSGIDFRGIVRAMVTNLFAGSVKEGASTITQQLAKTLVGSERSWARKVKEAILARRMEDLYSKEQILTWYINIVYFGHHSYGVQAAAQNYFRKNVWQLSLGEMALLAGAVQSPGRVNPALDLAGARRRAGHILDNMVELGWARAEEAQAAREAAVTVFPLRDVWGEQVPDFTEAVRRIGPRWGEGDSAWTERGLTIRMAVDPAAQRAAHTALDAALIALQKKQGYPGPLGRATSEAEREAFLAKNTRWVTRALEGAAPRIGSRLLARVTSVGGERAEVELGPGLTGSLDLKASSWATPWTVFPRDADGKVESDGKVSFAGKLSDLSRALAVGDVVMVRVVAPPPPPKPKPARKDKRGPKGKDGEATAEAPPPEAARPAFMLELEPVPMMEGALVSTPLEGGGLDALATGWDFDRSEVDRTLAIRQTGSTMKPIVYAKAYDLGLPPSALISGAPFREGKYNPTGARAKEDMLAWTALVESENAVSLRVHQHVQDRVSPEEWRAWGERLGLGRPLQGHTSEVLGMDQSPRDMLRAFATLARQGRPPALGLVRKVVARDGRVLERAWAPFDPWASPADAFIALRDRVAHPTPPVVSPTTSHLIAKNLAAAVRSGTGQKAKALGREAAGKTGTLAYDVWFAGFTGERAAIAWIGADRRERTLGPSERDNKVYGSTAALPMWVDFMRAVDRVDKGTTRPGVADVAPPEVVTVTIDPATGLLASGEGLAIPHRRGTEPTEMAPEPVSVESIDAVETEF